LKVIVQFTTPGGLDDLKSVPGVDLAHQTNLTLIGGTAVSVPPDQVLAVSKLPGVGFISLDRMVSATVDSAGALTNASMAWQSGWDGTGIGIAVIDSGIYAHDDLQDKDLNSRIVFRQDFTGSWVNDDYGHGTHVAGIIAGNGKSSPRQNGREVYSGVAPNANLIDLRVLDQNGVSTDSRVVAAIQKAIELKSRFNIRVINLSLGRPISEKAALDPLCRAVEEAWKAGIVVVVAAGNLGRAGYGTVLAPGNSPYAITVGAMNAMGTTVRSDDLITSYSSKGPTYLDGVVKPDIVAPGNSITSLMAPASFLATHYPQNRIFAWPNKMGALPYMSLSGTSMAAPAVSGAAALLLQRQPELTPDQIKARLMKTASKDFPATSTVTDPDTGISYTSQYDLVTIGAGYLDLWAALNNTDLAPGTAASPALQYDAASRSFYLANDTPTVWGSTANWSSSAVWGTNVFVAGSSAIWGTRAIWGSSATWGDSAVWGTSAMWGTSAIWGTSAVWGTNGQVSDSETLVTSSAR
jgi:serine protease AprX